MIHESLYYYILIIIYECGLKLVSQTCETSLKYKLMSKIKRTQQEVVRIATTPDRQREMTVYVARWTYASADQRTSKLNFKVAHDKT